jgi:hypothetical protein
MRLEGAMDIERALAQLPRAQSRAVSLRAMREVLRPVASAANAFWPGSSDDVFTIRTRLQRSQMGDSHMVRGRSIINLFVGAPGGATGTPHAHLIEFGTGPRYTRNGAFRGSVSPIAMLQPAWDMHRAQMLTILGQLIWNEIERVMAR